MTNATLSYLGELKPISINFQIIRPEGKYLESNICFFAHNNVIDFYEMNPGILNIKEKIYFDNLDFEKRKKSYLLGRFAAKTSVSQLLEIDYMDEFLIDKGIMGHPVLLCLNNQNIQVSITHCDDLGCAIAYPFAHPIALDIEPIKEDIDEMKECFMTNDEFDLVHKLNCTNTEKMSMIWTAKEALSKLLKTGLTTSFDTYEIAKCEISDGYWTCWFQRFTQYKAINFYAQGHAFSFAFPKKSELVIDIKQLKKMIIKQLKVIEEKKIQIHNNNIK